MIKDIVVNLGLGEQDPAGDFAISVADAFEAHVLGVAFVYDPVIPGSVMGGIPPEFIESQRAESEKTARAAVARFEQAAKRAGISYETRSSTPASPAPPNSSAVWRGASTLPSSASPSASKSAPAEVVDEGVLFESGRPVIFVPLSRRPASSSTASWCAGTAAAPPPAPSPTACRSCKRPSKSRSSWSPAKPARRRNSRRRSRPASRPPRPEGRRQAHHLAGYRRAVDDLVLCGRFVNADMIVMGGYGHSRLREFILGGVTRGILESMTVPALMSH